MAKTICIASMQNPSRRCALIGASAALAGLVAAGAAGQAKAAAVDTDLLTLCRQLDEQRAAMPHIELAEYAPSTPSTLAIPVTGAARTQWNPPPGGAILPYGHAHAP
jgi:hypothetical protein